MNEQYLKDITKKSRDELYEQFNFSDFDVVNIYLTNKILRKKNNLWFDLVSQNTNKFYQSITFALAVHFFEKNYCNGELPKVHVGDKFQNDSVRYEVVERNDNHENFEGTAAITLKVKNGTNQTRGMERTIPIELLRDKYTKLSDDAGNTNRNTFQPVFDFVEKTLGVKDNIPSFPNKFAIICSKQCFENSLDSIEKNSLPYEYITKNETPVRHLPLADFMIFVAPDYETIQTCILDKNIKLDLIVLFDNRDNGQIQQDINRGNVKKVIFVGGNKPKVDGFLKWQWTLPEYQYFEGTTQSKINIVKVENERLTQLTKEFIESIEHIENDHNINLNRLYVYLSYVYPLVIPTENSRLQNKIEDLSHWFKEKSRKVLGEEFNNISIDYNEHHVQLVEKYTCILVQFNYDNNAKTIKLKTTDEPDYLLAPEHQTLNIWQEEIKRINWQNVEIISLSKLKTLSGRKSITILSTKDYDFYCDIKNSDHKITWLLYDNECKQYEKYKIKYDNQLIAELRSSNRKELIGVEYPEYPIEESPEELMDRIFNQDQDDVDREYKINDLDHIRKKITFADESNISLSANSTIILIDNNNNAIKYLVSDLCIDDKIRVYENQHKEVLFEMLSNSDNNGKFKEILDNSELWKEGLKDYFKNNPQGRKRKEIADKCGVKSSTVKGWLKPNSSTKFPDHLWGIKDILGTDYTKAYNSKQNYHSIMIALGRDLSDEISDYVINKTKGQFLKQFDDETIKEMSTHNMPIKTIIKIETIEI